MSTASSPLRSPAALRSGARFLARLPSFLRSPLDPGQVQARHLAMARTRRERFLEIAERAVYANPRSTPARLLETAGCALGDLRELVEREGLEGTLDTLLRAGVYATVDEFKGRVPVVRGSTTLASGARAFANPLAAFHVPARSGGSRSAGTHLLIDLDFVRACGVVASLHLKAWGGSGWHKSTWESPGAAARFRLLKYASFGDPPAAWFAPVSPRDAALDPVFVWGDRAMRWGGRLAGVRLPRATVATIEDPLPVARWMRATLEGGATPFTLAITSSIVRLAVAATEAGLDLTGAHCILGGEPTTQARLTTIRASGIDALPRYGSSECGPVGYGCLDPTEADDVHVVTDLHALIQPGRDVGRSIGLPSTALMVTALHPAAPFLMLNLSMGDQAVMEERACGCPVEALGWTPHLRTIRSFEKLTAAGVTFLDTDVVRVLEHVLPARFGGGPTDYQLVELEDARGSPVLRLLVHPRLGPLDSDAVCEAFLTGLGGARSIDRIMAEQLRQEGALSVERSPPRTTSSGKVLHLHVGARPGA